MDINLYHEFSVEMPLVVLCLLLTYITFRKCSGKTFTLVYSIY